jgi:MFS family permease
MPSQIVRISVINGLVKGLIIGLRFFLAIYLLQTGFSGWQIGLIFTFETITNLLVILPSGLSNDRIHSKNLITLSLGILTLQFIGLTLTTSFLAICILFMIGGLAGRVYAISSESLFYRYTEKKDTSNKIGTFHGLNYLGMSSANIIAGLALYNGISFNNIFLFTAVCFAILGLISHLSLSKTALTEFPIIHYKKDLLRPKALFFMLIMFLFAIHIGAEKTTYGLFLQEYLELNKFDVGLYIGLAIFVMAPTVFIIGKKLKKFKAEKVLTFGLLSSGLGLILMSTKKLELSFAFRLIHEIGDAAIFFFLSYGITQLFKLERIGGNTSMFQLTISAGAALGAFFTGPLGEKFGYNWPLIITGSITLLAFLLSIQFAHLLKHNKEA